MNEQKGLTTHFTDPFFGHTEPWFYTTGGQDWTWGAIVAGWADLQRVIELHAPVRPEIHPLEHQRRVVITAGAHVGIYAYAYAHIFTAVYAFEPDALHFYCLVNNVQFRNVIKIQAALGETPAFVSMVGTSISATVTEDNITCPNIPVVTLDSFQFPVVDVIQLDVEGYELRALKGAIHTITTQHPLLILENGHYQEVIDFLTPLGYTCVERLQWDSIWKYQEPVNDAQIS